MKTIAIVFGGKSVEHDVSIITAKQVFENIDKSTYVPILVYIDKKGIWWTGKKLEDKKIYTNFLAKGLKKIFFKTGEKSFYFKTFFGLKKINIYAVVNCCHGTGGEDGCLQGLFESFDIAYSGADVLSSAICMNKIFMKRLFEFYNYPIVPYFFLKRGDRFDLDEKLKDFDFPLFVKPASLGSSIGIEKCTDKNKLIEAINIAFHFDEYVIIEKGVENLKEINCSVQMLLDDVECSDLEQPLSWKSFLSFDDKYLSGGKKGLAKRIIKVKLPKLLEQEVINLSKNCYKNFGLSRVVRIDYLYDKTAKKLFINEVNTIPGSLAFYLWKGKGISFKKHIGLQIEQAIAKQKIKNQNLTVYESKLLK